MEWAPRAAAVVDPTGAGDAFAAVTSFAIEDWGAAGLLRADRAAADSRLQAWCPA